MAKPTDIVTAADRITTVMTTEFPQLSPADYHFVLSVVAFEFLSKFSSLSGTVKRQPGEK